jgi:ADP-heptose:LPS heptosyltransferase
VEQVLESLPTGGRVAVIRLRSLGDCVLTTPALDILKRYRGDLRVGVAVEDAFRGVFEDNPDVDEILAPEVGAVRRFKPDLCLNLHGGTRSTSLTAMSGARWRAGFGHFRQQFLYNVRIPRAQQILLTERTVHTAEHLASAIFYLGAPRCKIPRAKLAPLAPMTKQRTAVLHASAAATEKTWPSARFLEVAEYLERGKLEPVFVGGPEDDLSPFARYSTLEGAPLSEVRRLLAGASVFVGNDSGPAHMAAAFGLPVVVIFGASDPAIWGPWRTTGAVVTAPAGIAAVETAQVLGALERLRVTA